MKFSAGTSQNTEMPSPVDPKFTYRLLGELNESFHFFTAVEVRDGILLHRIYFRPNELLVSLARQRPD